MASNSEKGHAKNIANVNLLNTIIEQTTIYNPSNSDLLLPNLQNIYTTAFTHQENVNIAIAPYTLAVDYRELLFKPLSKKITKLRKIFKSTQGVTAAQLEDFMTIARKLRGESKKKNNENEENQHSTYQMSFDQRTNNYGLLISLLQNTPNYNPNETEFKIVTLQAERTQMLQSTQSVANTYIPLNNARGIRNNTLYLSNNNLVDLFNNAKSYLLAILETNSSQYKAVNKIKFTKILPN